MAEKLRTNAERGLFQQMAIGLSSRLLLHTARRYVYTFMPILSRGLHVGLTSLTLIVSASQLIAVSGLVFSPIADRFGYKRMMAIGLFLLFIGMLFGAMFPFYIFIFMAFLFVGLARSLFDPAFQAYISQIVPFNRRGFYIGMTEFSYAGSALVGIPLMSLIIHYFGWRTSLAFMGGAGFFLLFSVLRKFEGFGSDEIEQTRRPRFADMYVRLIRDRAALGMMGFAFFLSISNDIVFVVYSPWLEKVYHIQVVELGMGMAVIGVAELCGSVLTTMWSDRIGLKSAIFWGALLTTLFYGLLPVVSRTLYCTYAGLFLLFFSFEFTIVSAISLATEVLPGARATMMAGFYGATGIGRTIGALLGIPIWLHGGILTTAVVACAVNICGLAAFAWGFRRWKERITRMT